MSAVDRMPRRQHAKLDPKFACLCEFRNVEGMDARGVGAGIGFSGNLLNA